MTEPTKIEDPNVADSSLAPRTDAQQAAGNALDGGIAMPEAIAEKLSDARRQAVQQFERNTRSANGYQTKSKTVWLWGGGLAAAALGAVMLVPNLQPSAPSASAMPIGLIAAEEELEFFESMEYLQQNLSDESTS